MGLQNSKIIICKNIKIDKSYKDVLDYTENQMLALCQANAVASANNYSFIRKEKNVISTSFSYNDALKCNYMAFQNTDYSNKWFFAFIDDVEYSNDGTARIHYTVDEFSTWFDYWNPEPCFIEREHVNDDTIGLHTVPEGLEHGEYIINVCGELETDLDDCYVILGVTWLPNNTPGGGVGGGYRGGVYSGLTYLVFDINRGSPSKFIQAYDKMAKSDSIIEIFMCPKKFCVPVTWYTASFEDITDIKFGRMGGTLGAVIIRDDITLTNVNTLNGYSPKNNKLFVYPYCVLSITNNSGTQANYNYEDFVNNTPIFSIAGTVTPGVSMKMFPNNYKKFANTPSIRAGYDFGIIGGKYPMGSWQSDPYTNWLTQQSVNYQMSALNFGLNVIGSANRGDVMGGVTSAVNQIGGMMNEYYQHALQPPQSHGTNSGDVNFGMSQMGYTYYKMSIKYEYARIIDEFLSRFGYKINRVKLPNQTGRRYWNFVKIGSGESIGFSTNESRSVPASSMDVINNIYRNGTTIWHDHANVGKYNLDNVII